MRELREMLADLNNAELLSLNDFKDVPEIQEDGNTYFDNSLKKAKIVSEYTGEMALADDSGLEVDYLGGAPGIYSSRYAGENATDAENVHKLIEALKYVPPEKRKAIYRCVLVFYQTDGTYECFSGSWEGQISDEPLGDGGFGYDPVFFLPSFGLTVSQLPADIKNSISHRAVAFAKFRERLQQKV